MRYDQKTADKLKLEIENAQDAINNQKADISNKKAILASLDKQIKQAEVDAKDADKKAADSLRSAKSANTKEANAKEKLAATEQELKVALDGVNEARAELAQLLSQVDAEKAALVKARENFNTTMGAIKEKARQELAAANAILS